MIQNPRQVIGQVTEVIYGQNFDGKGAAKRLKVAEQTLANWRHLRKGPAYIKMSGGKIIYREADLDAYLNARRIDPEKDSH